jgi:hypothetical protein
MKRSILVSVVILFAGTACGDSQQGKPDAVYRVRAQVVELHGSGDDRRVTAAHEAIPEFRDRSGTPSGMEAMSMAFGIGSAVDATALRAGTKWDLTFEVRWKREPPLLITAAKPLPPDTRLTLAPSE